MNGAKFYIAGRPCLDEPYHLKGVGLPNIYLLNGVTFENDPDYGELVTIENLEGLHRAIGLHIVEKCEPMTGAELRFLRKQMDLTQVQLAKRMAVTDQTIANYEKGKTGRNTLGSADLTMRLLYLVHVLPPESRTCLLKEAVEVYAACEAEVRKKLPELPRRKLVGKWTEPVCLAAA